MLYLQRAQEAAHRIGPVPRLVVIGLVVMAVGGGLDLLVHLAPGHADSHAGFHPQEHLAHLVGVVGMALIWTGVVLDGARRHLRRAVPAHERSGFHADR